MPGNFTFCSIFWCPANTLFFSVKYIWFSFGCLDCFQHAFTDSFMINPSFLIILTAYFHLWLLQKIFPINVIDIDTSICLTIDWRYMPHSACNNFMTNLFRSILSYLDIAEISSYVYEVNIQERIRIYDGRFSNDFSGKHSIWEVHEVIWLRALVNEIIAAVLAEDLESTLTWEYFKHRNYIVKFLIIRVYKENTKIQLWHCWIFWA